MMRWESLSFAHDFHLEWLVKFIVWIFIFCLSWFWIFVYVCAQKVTAKCCNDEKQFKAIELNSALNDKPHVTVTYCLQKSENKIMV